MFDCESRLLAKDVTTYADLHAGRGVRGLVASEEVEIRSAAQLVTVSGVLCPVPALRKDWQ